MTSASTALAEVGAGNALASVFATGHSLGVPKPFANPICLVESTVIAGTSHIKDISERIMGLDAGTKLTFKRDAGNSHDKWAIKVMNAHDQRLGFVSCEVNEILARLMDGGKELYANVLEIELLNTWYRIKMEVFLND